MREKKYRIEPDSNQLTRISVEMTDEFHHLEVQFWVEEEKLAIVRIELKMFRHPEPGCPDSVPLMERLKGTPLFHPHFRQILLRKIGGKRGCFHVMDLLIEAQDYARSYFWDQHPDARGAYKISRAPLESQVRCIAFKD